MKTIILIAVIYLLISSLAAITTPRSLAFADSYGLRAYGSDALYWNPASLVPGKRTFDIPITNLQFRVENNAMSLNTYNSVTGQYIDDDLKDKILSGFKGHLGFNGNVHSTIIGTSFGHMGLGIGVNAIGSARISKQYLNLLFYGNEDSQVMNFTQKHNDGEGVLFSDITLGSGNYEISKLIPPYVKQGLPPVRFGIAVSLLTGIKGYEVTHFNGHFSTEDDGINLIQDTAYNEGTMGFGYKAMIGFKSEPMKNLEVGLTFDNIAGQIKWSGSNKRHYSHVEIDSVYLADLDEDIADPTDSTTSMGTFTTKLPAEMNTSVLYHLGKASFSLDWKQGFRDSFLTTKQPKLSLGVEFLPTKKLPIQFGYSIPTKYEPYRFAYGFGLRFRRFETGFSLQSSHALFPSYLSRGFTFALHSRMLY